MERLRESPPENGIGDRGFRGGNKVGETIIHIPKPFSKKLSAYMQRKQKKHFRKRTGIEPVIAHLKADHRLSRNFYKGIFGDNINIMLAAGFNFKRMMNKWKVSFLSYLEQVFRTITMMPNLFAIDNKIKNNSKWAFLGSTKYPFILLAMMASVLSSCLDPQPQAPVLLEQAERLMKDRPDSAMRLVDSIFYPEKSVSQIR